MAPPKKLDAKHLRDILGGSGDDQGVFFSLLGFRTGTTAIKAVHVLNDLAQHLCGQMPFHGGDLLCRLIRQHHERAAIEGNSDSALRSDARLRAVYKRAYPEALGPQLVSELRLATGAVLNADGGIYEPGKNMASSLATNVGLLGKEGFRRFQVGPFLATILRDEGRQRLIELFRSDTDPVSRFLRPITRAVPLETLSNGCVAYEPSDFDVTLGKRLSNLLEQPVSKPTLLRFFALAVSLGLLFKVHGVGRDSGRPALLALASEWVGGRPLRRQAVQALLRGRDNLDRAIATNLSQSDVFAELLQNRVPKSAPFIELASAGADSERAIAVIQAMRQHRPKRSAGESELYWPEQFALALGRKAGAILPRDTRAGWGQYAALSPEHVEVLTMMFVDPNGSPLSWTAFWKQVREDFGVVVGANPFQDARYLEESGIRHCELEELAANARALLDQACHRSVARLLPDSGAEVGGSVA